MSNDDFVSLIVRSVKLGFIVTVYVFLLLGFLILSLILIGCH